MTTPVFHIFTYHDHLFKIVGDYPGACVLEDEYGTQKEISDPGDLEQVREACGSVLQGYREEMSMPGAKS